MRITTTSMRTNEFSAAHIVARKEVLDAAVATGRIAANKRSNFAALLDVSFESGARMIATLPASSSVAAANAAPAPVAPVPSQTPSQAPQASHESWLTRAEQRRVAEARNGGGDSRRVIVAPND